MHLRRPEVEVERLQVDDVLEHSEVSPTQALSSVRRAKQ